LLSLYTSQSTLPPPTYWYWRCDTWPRGSSPKWTLNLNIRMW
jgi:hypothetical protein